MKTITYKEMPNGAKILSEEGDKLDILEEITMDEFEKKFPDLYISSLLSHFTVFLENGVVLIDDEWNGEVYEVDGVFYHPVYEQHGEDDFDIVGYEESNW